MSESTAGSAASAPKKRHRARTITIVAAAVVVLVAAGIATYQLTRPHTGSPAPAFTRTVAATKGTQTQQVSLTGTLAPQKRADLNFDVSGTVTAVYVKVGDQVKKGDKLATIDDSDLQDALDLAEANLTSADAAYDEAVDNDSSSAAVKSAKARVDQAKAARDQAKTDLKNAVLTSSISGTVAALDLEKGDTIGSTSSSAASSGASSSGLSGLSGSSSSASSSSSAQVSVISTSTWKVDATVGSADLGSLKAGQTASVQADGASQALDGTVDSVGIVASSTSSDGTATFPVVVDISGKQKGLYSGTNAQVVVTTASADDVLTVPTAAITTLEGKTQVTVSQNGQNTPVDVTVGRVFGKNTEITAGLSEGDQVVVETRLPAGLASAGANQTGGTWTEGRYGGQFGGSGMGAPDGGQPPMADGAGPGQGR